MQIEENRPNENKYGVILDHLLEGCAIVDYNWRYLYCNKAHADHVQNTVNNLTGKIVFECDPNFFGSPFHLAQKKCMDTREPQTLTSGYLFANGIYKALQVNVEPVPEGIFVLSLDITEKELVQKELKESEEKYRTLFNSIDVGFCLIKVIFDEHEIPSDFVYLEMNPAFEKISGLQNAKGKNVMSVFPETEKFWLDIYGTIANNGEPLRFHNYFKPLNKYFNVYAFRHGTPGERKVAVLFSDFTEQKHYEEQLQNSKDKLEIQLKEKEALVKEVFHRTKNTLQIISSLLNLKSSEMNNLQVDELVKYMQNRILSISLVQEKIYKSSDLSTINLKDYVKTLAEELLRSNKKTSNISLNLELNDVMVLLDTVIPCGLVLTEIITNSLNHAFPDGSDGIISISLRKLDDENILLIAADNGKGLNKNINDSDTLGIQLLKSIATEQMLADVKLDYSEGVKWTISFKNNLYKPRV